MGSLIKYLPIFRGVYEEGIALGSEEGRKKALTEVSETYKNKIKEMQESSNKIQEKFNNQIDAIKVIIEVKTKKIHELTELLQEYKASSGSVENIEANEYKDKMHNIIKKEEEEVTNLNKVKENLQETITELEQLDEAKEKSSLALLSNFYCTINGFKNY